VASTLPIVKRLAREGAHVALTYVSNPDRANETVKAAQTLGVKALAIQADSADDEALVAAVEQTVRELGGIDILVNSAGIAKIAPIDDYRLPCRAMVTTEPDAVLVKI
jgi:3-oxoacyl-[acyl-carrier protein] reductase